MGCLTQRWLLRQRSGCLLSSYTLVFRGLDSKSFNKRYPHKRVRHEPVTSNLNVACLRRYHLARGSRAADQYQWSYPPTPTISAKPLSVYVVYRSSRTAFATFTDVVEAVLYANTLRVYLSEDSRVVKVAV